MSIEIFEKSKICCLCGEQDPPDKHYWVVHKQTIKSFYEQYYTKFNLLTKEPILFKDKESYIQNSFNDKNELRAWMKDNNKDVVLNYLINWLKIRKEIKNLIYTLGQFEARSLLFPSISYIIKNYGLEFWKKMNIANNLIIKYDYDKKIITETEKLLYFGVDTGKQLNFIVDSREQSVLDVPNKQIQKMDVGDYTIEGSDIIIEKKSISDLCGTLSKGFDRFCRELDRAKEQNKYVIILVEEKFSNIVSLRYLPHTKRIKATSEFIFHRAREIIYRYPLNCQIVCINGRREAVIFIEKVFKLKNDPKLIDFQYLVDTGQII